MALYELLLRISDNPVVALNHAVAVAMVHGPAPGSTCSDGSRPTSGSPTTTGSHAVRAHLLEMAGEHRAARTAYQAAARRTTSLPQQRYLHARAARLDGHR